MRRHYITAWLCSLVFMISTALAETPGVTELLAPFDGEWVSSGPAFGAPARSTMRWAPDLNEKFLRLNYRIEMQSDGPAPIIFKGVAYYKTLSEEKLTGFWADNSGDLHPITADWDGDALVALWGVAGKKQGRTRYEFVNEDEMTVTDWIKTDEGWRQFNHNVFLRQPASAP